jgi:AcrR family transcriptional regulator
MTKQDIIQSAFRVWGRELYQRTSLSQIAGDLGVTKPALYRHFHNKQALLDGMYESFFDDFAGFVKPEYERALGAGDPTEGLLIMTRAIVRYYCLNRGAFIFSLVEVYGNRGPGNMARQMALRGIGMRQMPRPEGEDAVYPPRLQLVITTVTFLVAHFHKFKHECQAAPSEAEVEAVIASVEATITHGLGLSAETVGRIDFAGLEQRLSPVALADSEDDGLLRAVAGAVAEAGPWNASMDMVARRSGLSKSGLYSHFKNRQDMFRQFFVTEIDRLIAYAEAGKRNSTVAEEQLYLVIGAIADYFRSRPEILFAADWLRTRRIDLGVAIPPGIFRVLADIRLPSLPEGGGGAMRRSGCPCGYCSSSSAPCVGAAIPREPRLPGRMSRRWGMKVLGFCTGLSLWG